MIVQNLVFYMHDCQDFSGSNLTCLNKQTNGLIHLLLLRINVLLSKIVLHPRVHPFKLPFAIQLLLAILLFVTLFEGFVFSGGLDDLHE